MTCEPDDRPAEIPVASPSVHEDQYQALRRYGPVPCRLLVLDCDLLEPVRSGDPSPVIYRGLVLESLRRLTIPLAGQLDRDGRLWCWADQASGPAIGPFDCHHAIQPLDASPFFTIQVSG